MDLKEIQKNAAIKFKEAFISDTSVAVINQLMEKIDPHLNGDKKKYTEIRYKLLESYDSTMDKLIQKGFHQTWIQKLISFPFTNVLIAILALICSLDFFGIQLPKFYLTCIQFWLIIIVFYRTLSIIGLYRYYQNMVIKVTFWVNPYINFNVIQLVLLIFACLFISIEIFKTPYLIIILLGAILLLSIGYQASQKISFNKYLRS